MLAYFVITPILIAVFLYFFSDKLGRIISIIAQIALSIAAFYLFYRTQSEEILTNVGNFRGYSGIYLRADSLSAVFVLLTALVFLFTAVYSFHDKYTRLFWFLLFIWQGALVGLFLTRDFFNIFVLIEVSTIVVAVLLMYIHGKRNMYDGVVFLMSNIVAVQFYLFGLGYLYMLTGVLDMEAAGRAVAVMDSSQLFLPYALLMTSLAFKCAIIPLSSWIVKVAAVPRAPVPIAAILSAIHVKVGLYLFIRFQDVFAPIAANEFFLVIGIITGFFGVVKALAQRDIMLILAYSSVAQVGLIIVGISQGGEYAMAGALYHIINHALFKAALFFSAGMIVQKYNTRNIVEICGLLKNERFLSIATFLSILGIIGAPFFNGSISKYFMAAYADPLVFGAMTVINLGTITVFIKYSKILLGTAPAAITSATHAPPDRCKQSVIMILALLCLAFGVMGRELVEVLFGMNVNISLQGYIEKAVIFVVSIVVGLVIVRLLKFRDPLPAIASKTEMSFRGIAASMGAFFAIILLVVSIL